MMQNPSLKRSFEPDVGSTNAFNGGGTKQHPCKKAKLENSEKFVKDDGTFYTGSYLLQKYTQESDFIKCKPTEDNFRLADFL